MPNLGWMSLSLPVEVIDELKAELKKDKVFKSMASILVYAWRTYMKNRKSEDVLGNLLDRVSFLIMYVDQVVKPPLGAIAHTDSQKINLELWQEVKETGLPFWNALHKLKNLKVKA